MPRVVGFRVGDRPVVAVHISGRSWTRPIVPPAPAAEPAPEPVALHAAEYSILKVSRDTYAGQAVMKAHPSETLQRAVFSVRNSSGAKFDFGAAGPIEVDWDGVVLAGQRQFTVPGEYTYTISVQKQDGKWYNLIRTTPFTVG